MSNTTISKLASALKISSDKLITQLNDAGISVDNENDEISNDQKLTLLNHLRGSHGTKKEIKELQDDGMDVVSIPWISDDH